MRAQSGITELDEMLHGGFMTGDAVLLAGSPGTGKTTVGLRFLAMRGTYSTFRRMGKKTDDRGVKEAGVGPN